MSYLESGTRQWNKHETPVGLLYNSIEPLVTLVVLAWDVLFTALCPPSFKKSFSHIQNSPSWESKLGFTASFIARVHRLPQTVNSRNMSQRVCLSVCLSPSTFSCGTSVSAQKPTIYYILQRIFPSLARIRQNHLPWSSLSDSLAADLAKFTICCTRFLRRKRMAKEGLEQSQ